MPVPCMQVTKTCSWCCGAWLIMMKLACSAVVDSRHSWVPRVSHRFHVRVTCLCTVPCSLVHPTHVFVVIVP